MKRPALPFAALLPLAYLLASLQPAHAASKPSAADMSTDADYMYTQRDSQLLRLQSSVRGVVVELAKPSPLIGLIADDIIQSVDSVRVNRVRALTDIIRKRKGHSVVLTVQRNGQTRTVRVSAQDCEDWMTSHPQPPSPPASPAGQ